MKSHHALFICLALVVTCRCTLAGPQTVGTSQVTESIGVTDYRPLAAALMVLEKKYGLAVTYEDPVYSNLSDIQDVTPPLAVPAIGTSSHKIFIPRKRSFHFEYTVENGKLREDTKTLIGRMLAEYATLGNPVFDVQERKTKLGSQWNVVPVKVRNDTGQFIEQTALLDSVIYIPKQTRKYNDMLGEIIAQASSVSGYQIVVSNFPMNYFFGLRDHEAEHSADHRSARDALAELLGPDFIWYLFHVPGEHKFFLDIHTKIAPPSSVPLPKRFSPYDESGHLINPGTPVSREYAYSHSPVLRTHYPLTHDHILGIQSALTRAGFYQGDPTGVWDPNTIEALKKFQSANGLAITGRSDESTLEKLGVLPPFAGRSSSQIQAQP